MTLSSIIILLLTVQSNYFYRKIAEIMGLALGTYLLIIRLTIGFKNRFDLFDFADFVELKVGTFLLEM